MERIKVKVIVRSWYIKRILHRVFLINKEAYQIWMFLFVELKVTKNFLLI